MLYLDRRGLRAEADAELGLAAVAGELFRRQVNMNGLAVAKQREVGGCAVAILQVGEQRDDRVRLQLIDLQELVAGFEPGA